MVDRAIRSLVFLARAWCARVERPEVKYALFVCCLLMLLSVDMSDGVLHSAAVVRMEGFLLETERSSLFASAAVVGVCLLVGLVAGGWVLGSEIKDIRLADRYVTVKGLVERTVKSDMATWPVSFKEAGNDLPQVFAKSEGDKTAVLKFFAEQGIAAG